MSSLMIIHEIRFSPEATVLLERVAASIAALGQFPSPASVPAQTAAPGVSAPDPWDSASPPTEGPSRAASGTYAGQPERSPGVSFRGWLTERRREILKMMWPTDIRFKEIFIELEATNEGPLPEPVTIRRAARTLGLSRPDGIMGKNKRAKPSIAVPAPPPDPLPPPVETPAPPMAQPVVAMCDVPPRPATEAFDRREIMRRIAAIKPPAVNHGTPEGTPVVAGQEAIRAWAYARGVDMGGAFDLDAANAKAAAIGHPGFTLKTRLG